LPLIVDPSHATGIASLVCPAALAAVAAGADGLMIEVHPNPAEALTDGDQSITPEAFDNMMAKLNLVAVAVGKELPKQKKGHARRAHTISPIASHDSGKSYKRFADRRSP
ncbi:MAG: phospho-2-dehydro-3-deoxyheptonate aldolase, partial [Candidatus Gracilibacteria bacterium]